VSKHSIGTKTGSKMKAIGVYEKQRGQEKIVIN
jgi:hypothetical protein